MQILGPPGRERQDEPARSPLEASSTAFGDTADPSLYVPRSASESALAGLESVLRGRALVGALSGPPGLGKTLLLRVLEARSVADARAVYLPYASLTLEELCAWALGLLDRSRARDPVAGLREVACRRDSDVGPLLLLVDDANSMPVETARALGELAEGCAGDLLLVLAAPDDARTSRVVAALGLDILERRLDQPMTEEETQAYVSARLRSTDADPSIWRHLGRGMVRRLHSLSGGNPRRLHVLASEVLRGEAGHHVLRKIEPAWPELLIEDGDAADTSDDPDELALDPTPL